jgi:hypothetical protein
MSIGSTCVVPRTCFAGRSLGWMLSRIEARRNLPGDGDFLAAMCMGLR